MNTVGLVDGALEICSRHFGALLAVVLPGYLLLGAGLLLLVSFAELPPPQYSGGFLFYIVAGAVVSVLMFLSHISHGAGVYYLYRVETGLSVTVGEALGRAFRRSGSLVLVGAVSYGLACVAAPILVIPGVAVYSIFALCTPAVMIEDMSYMRAIKRGYRMLREFFGRAFKAHLLLGVLWGVLLLSLHATIHISLSIVRSFFDLEVGLLTNALSLSNLTYLAFLNVIVLLVFAGVLCGLAVLLYIDVRVRTEGIDIERKIEALPELEMSMPLNRDKQIAAHEGEET
jgi:hypothetical protein